MSEQKFCEMGFVGTQFASGVGKSPKLQLDIPHSYHSLLSAGYIQISKEEAEALGRALLQWSQPQIFGTGEVYLDSRRKSFEFSTECPRCLGRFTLMYFSRTEW